MTFKTSYLTYRHVGEYVEDFLQKYHSSLQLPIPIEWIIESDLGLHIVSLVIEIRIRLESFAEKFKDYYL